jgi:hypothetical protein
MATQMDQVRGLILEEAKERPSEGLLHSNGLPNARRIAARLGLSHQVLWRILRGQREVRSDAKRRRVHELRVTPDIIDGLMGWLNLTSEEDVWAKIRRTEPVPPLETTRRRS